MAVIMAFSVTCGMAVSAFADDLTAGTIGEQSLTTQASTTVYDTVYGVFGNGYGDYALMMKSVTYEAQYGDISNYTYYATIADVVKADGTVAVHTNDAPQAHQSYLPGTSTDYQLDWLNGYGRDIEAGFVKVTQKSTSKMGVKTLDGKQIIPCSYDSITLLSNGDFQGVSYNGSTVAVSFMDATGKSLGSYSFAAAQKTDNTYVYSMYYGNYVQTRVSIYDPSSGSSQSYQSYAKKDGSTYKQVTDVDQWLDMGYSPVDYAIVVKTDGNVYYSEAGGDEVYLEQSQGYSYSGSDGYHIVLVKSDGSADYFTTDGKKIDIGESEVKVWLDKGYVAWSVDDETEEGYWKLYDFDGKLVNSFDADVELNNVYNDSRYFTVKSPVADSDESAEWALDVYDSAGKLVKKELVVTDCNLEFSAERQYDYSTSSYTVIGYSLHESWFDEDGDYRQRFTYFDTNFNTVESRADLTGSSWQQQSALGYEDVGSYYNWNAVKHGNADVIWQANASGKWGAVNSSGTTVIPYEYEAYFDIGAGTSDYALVKKGGNWLFIKVAGSNVGTTTAVKELSEPDDGSSTKPVDPSDPSDSGTDPTPVVDGTNVSSAWRAAGSDALDTMSKIVDKGNFAKGGTVVLATFDGYWDALAGAGIAGLTDAPVLMTPSNSLASATEAQLKKLAPKTIVVCGGTAALSAATAEAAAKAAGGATIVRAAGADAPDTAVKVFQTQQKLGLGDWSDTAFVCTVEGYWDALAAAPIAYAKNMPIFLTSSSSTIASGTLSAMKQGGIKNVYIVGGTAAITPAVEQAVKDAGFTVAGRLAGNTAVETSEAVAEFGISLGMVANGVGIATTNGYWDALSGAALCGHIDSVLVLAENQNSHSVGSKGFLKTHADEIADVNIFGGTAAVSSATETAILASAK